MMSKSGPSQQQSFETPFKILKEYQYASTAVSELLHSLETPDPQLIYLYGPSGCGKSALIHHLLPEYLALHPGAEWELLTASEFAARFALASSNQQIADFQKGLRGLDLLILEDVHSLENRSHTQQELLSTLDDILGQGGRIIVSATKPPGELALFLKKLTNRFHGGICAAIPPPDFQSRQELLEFWAEVEAIPLPKKELMLIAQKKDLSPRELFAVLKQLQTVSRINRQPLDSRFVKQYLQGNLEPPRTSTAKITRAVCREFKTTLAEIRSANRSQQYVLPRQCAMFLSRELTDESLAKIANYFNRKNHSTVIHACRQIQTDLEKSPGLRQQISRIKQQLGVYLL